MKLCEFITITPNDLNPKNVSQTGKKQWKSIKPTKKPIGRGVYASVYGYDEDPGAVEKLAKSVPSLENDGYFQYLTKLAQNQASANNLYFPKIFDLKVYRGNDGQYTYKANIEKLLPSQSLSTQEIFMIGDNLFDDFSLNWKPFKQWWMQNNVKLSQKNILLYYFCTFLRTGINNSSYARKHIKDPMLIKALETIKQILKYNTISIDLHPNNIMVRRGGFIPQIVIIDPVHSRQG